MNTERRVSVRLVAEGGRQVRAVLDDVGEGAKKGFGSLRKEIDLANRRAAVFWKRFAIGAAAAATAVAGSAALLVRSGLTVIDNQAKLAQSIGATVEGVQVLDRAGQLAGASLSDLEGGVVRLTRRLSLAEAGAGPAAGAIERLGLSARALTELPLQERLATIAQRIREVIPEAERAGVVSQLFGDRAFAAFDRILQAGVIEQAASDVRDFGVAVSQQDAAQIERTNDSLSRLSLIGRGVANQFTVAVAPALERISEGFAAFARDVMPRVASVIQAVGENLGRLAATAAAFAAFVAGRLVVALGLAVASVQGLVTGLVLLRGALIRTGIGAVVVGLGELIFRLQDTDSAVRQTAERLLGLAASSSEVDTTARAAAAGQDALAVAMGGVVSAEPGASAAAVALANNNVALAESALKAAEAEIALASAQVASLQGGVSTARRDGLQRAASDREVAATEALARAQELLDNAQRDRQQSGGQIVQQLAQIFVTTDNVVERTEALATSTRAAGGAAREAGREVADAAEVALQGWAAVIAQLDRYRDAATAIGQQAGSALVSGLNSAEDALVDFVTKGKLDFKSLVDSVISDLARIAVRQTITGPLSGALSSALGGGGLGSLFGIGARVNHSGGMAGTGPVRDVPALAFANAPRLHNGSGVLGLRSDEVPTILQKGERVQSRREVQAGGDMPAVNVTIMAQDVESFRRSRVQIGADLSRAVGAARRGS